MTSIIVFLEGFAMAILHYYITNVERVLLSSDSNVVEMFLFIFELKMLHKAVQKIFYAIFIL